MHAKEKEPIALGFKRYDFARMTRISREVLEDFVKENNDFSAVAILNLSSCPCHPEYRIYYRILH